MAIRKHYEETLDLKGRPGRWFDDCVEALEDAKFSNVRPDEEALKIFAAYRSATAWGDVEIQLDEGKDGRTLVEIHVDANVDNLWALFKSPGRFIIETFKASLDGIRPIS